MIDLDAPMLSRLPIFHTCLMGLCLASSTALAQGVPLKDATPHVSVTGIAQVDVVPDVAILSFAVQTEKPTPQQASAENATAAQAIIAELKADNIDAKNIRTVSATLMPVYDDNRDATARPIKRTLRGYQARNEIEVRLHAIDKASELAQKLVAKGANLLTGVRFDIEKPEARIKALQEQAAQDALANAQSYARPLGLKLKRVIEINSEHLENQKQFFRFTGGSTFGEETTGPAIPLEPGTKTLSARVSVTWELGE